MQRASFIPTFIILGEYRHPAIVAFIFMTGVGLSIPTVGVLSPTETPLLLWLLLFSSAERKAATLTPFACSGRIEKWPGSEHLAPALVLIGLTSDIM